jgi:hypothetical protein
MGELWTARWEWHVVDRDGPALEMSVATPITPARFTKVLRLHEDAPVLDIAYRIEHVGTKPFDYLWGVHPCLAISPSHRFDVPALRGLVDEWVGGGIGRAGDAYAWPNLPLPDGSTLDVRKVLAADSDSLALHYLSDLREGWTACTDTSTHRGFGLVFDQVTFPVVWLWLVYGAWRGHYHAAMELWTGYPGALAKAIESGRAREMLPGSAIESSVSAVLYSGVDEVAHLLADGSVTGSLY